MTPLIVLTTPGAPQECPKANRPGAPDGVCLGCVGREKCRKALSKPPANNDKGEIVEASLGSLAYETNYNYHD